MKPDYRKRLYKKQSCRLNLWVGPPGPTLSLATEATCEHHTCAPEAMHIYLLQEVHEAGVDLGQEAQQEDEREAQGEHCPGGGVKAQLACQPGLTLQTHSLGLILPCLTSGHISGAEEERGREEREAVERDRWEGLSGTQGIQHPDE